jgi:hypothetical protein
MHYPLARFYIRRVRIPNKSDLLPAIIAAGYRVEPCEGLLDTTSVVEFIIDCGENIRKVSEISMWEQLHLAAFLQENWSDNQVSATISFDPEQEASQIKHALDYFQYKLKGVSFLPNSSGTYPQMPYEEIDEETYNERYIAPDALVRALNSVMQEAPQEPEREDFCDGDTCTARPKAKRVEELSASSTADDAQ